MTKTSNQLKSEKINEQYLGCEQQIKNVTLTKIICRKAFTAMSTIKVSRDSGYADRIRDYKVICNSEVIGKISDGQTKVFEIPEGKHEIYMKIDWCRSNKLQIDITVDKQLCLFVGSNLRGIKILLAIFFIFFAPHKYLFLRDENS